MFLQAIYFPTSSGVNSTSITTPTTKQNSELFEQFPGRTVNCLNSLRVEEILGCLNGSPVEQ